MMRRFFLKLMRRRRLDDELEQELAFHREMSTVAGNPIPLGNAGFIKEQALDLWRFNARENLWRDLVYAARGLRRSPGLLVTALLSLGRGIGVNAAMFSLAVDFLLSQPSVRDAHSLAYVRQSRNSHVAPEVIEELRRSGVFADVAGENAETFINFDDGVETRRIFAVQATKNYFAALGIPLAQGRGWNTSDANEVVVLHPRFWRTRLQGDPAIIGKTIRLDGRLYTVLGILPDNYHSLVGFGYAPDVFLPQYIEGTLLQAYGRLKPGTSIGQLNSILPALGDRLAREYSWKSESEKQLHATPVSGFARLEMQGEVLAVGLFFTALLAMAGLVLLIACVNVAGLLLARASVRRQEIAIRLAIGASRGRLLQQLLAESLLLSLAGVALGLLFAEGTAKAAAGISLPVPMPIRLQMQPDWRVVCYAGLLAVLSALASGLMPAWQSLKESLAVGLKREKKLRMRRALVVAQIAVSFLVLTTAALFMHNLLKASSLGPGFDVRRTLRAEVYLPPAMYKSGATINPFVARAIERLRAIPGVDCAAAARVIPFTDNERYGSDLTFPGGVIRNARFSWNAVTPDFFRAMHIAMVQGREFMVSDAGTAKVVVVNDVFVRQYMAGRDPLNTPLRWGEGNALYQIVGVARATKTMTIGEEPQAQLYQPLAQIRNDRQRIQFVVRSLTAPAGQVTAVRDALKQAEPASGIEVSSMFSAIGFAFLPSQVGAALMGAIGALALFLALMGLYGVLAYAVARRTREIGIRMAVGASTADVARMVLADFARLLITGMAIGLVTALLVTRPLAMFFVAGLSASDPASFAAVIVLLALTGLLASAGPLRRALRVDPVRCLRYE